MRATPLLLSLTAVLLAAGCDGNDSALEPTIDDDSPAPVEAFNGPQEDLAYWADGYLTLGDKTAATSTPNPKYSFNRAGGAISVTRVAGTTGRYVATFRGLSAVLGTRSSVHVTAAHDDVSYCHPVGGNLVSDKVEVRCYRMGSGLPVNALFTVMVIGRTDARAFAFANQPTAADYAPASAGSWNPTGATRVLRDGVGQYRVIFKSYGTRFNGNWGHVQVSSAGIGKAHCTVGDWGVHTDFSVEVQCFTPGGAPVDNRFTIVATPPAAHLGYAWDDVPLLSSYSPDPTYSWNPVGGAIKVFRMGKGYYWIDWNGTEAEIRDYGGIQVTSYGGKTQCKVFGWMPTGAAVKCFGPDGKPVDSKYGVMVHS